MSKILPQKAELVSFLAIKQESNNLENFNQQKPKQNNFVIFIRQKLVFIIQIHQHSFNSDHSFAVAQTKCEARKSRNVPQISENGLETLVLYVFKQGIYGAATNQQTKHLCILQALEVKK